MNILAYSVDTKIFKGVGAQIVIRTFKDQFVRTGRWSKSLCFLIIAALPNEAGLPNEYIS
jgi:hypothetical protein